MYCLRKALVSTGRRLGGTSCIHADAPLFAQWYQFRQSSSAGLLCYTAKLSVPRLPHLGAPQTLVRDRDDTDLFETETGLTAAGLYDAVDEWGGTRMDAEFSGDLDGSIGLENSEFDAYSPHAVDGGSNYNMGAPSADLTPTERLSPVLDALSELDSSDLIDDFLNDLDQGESVGHGAPQSEVSRGALARASRSVGTVETSSGAVSLEDLEATSLGESMARGAR